MNSDRKFSEFHVDNVGEIQMHGVLMKKPVGHKSSIWSKRFFVLKEGFLFYYSEAEKKAFSDKGIFNIHPKGVIPLGHSTIEETSLPGVNYGITISFADESNAICLGAEKNEERQEWIEKLDSATKITLENCHLGDSLIKTLQDQTLALTKEKEKYYQKFLEQAEEVATEKKEKHEIKEHQRRLAENNLKLQSIISGKVASNNIDFSDSSDIEITENIYDLVKPGVPPSDGGGSEDDDGQYQTVELAKSFNHCDDNDDGLEYQTVDLMCSNNHLNRPEASEYQEIKHSFKNKPVKQEPSKGTSDSNRDEEKEELELLVENLSKEIIFLENQNKTLQYKYEEIQSLFTQLTQDKSNVSDCTEESHLQVLMADKILLEEKLKKETENNLELKNKLAEIEKRNKLKINYETTKLQGELHDEQTPKDVKNLKNYFEGYITSNPKQFSSRFSRRYSHIKKLRGIPVTENFKQNGVDSNQDNQPGIQSQVITE